MNDMTIDEYLTYWHKLNIALFGAEEAMKIWEHDRKRNQALKKLWISKGFNTYAEFEAWERTHIAEKNAFLERAMNG